MQSRYTYSMIEDMTDKLLDLQSDLILYLKLLSSHFRSLLFLGVRVTTQYDYVKRIPTAAVNKVG